MSSTAVHDWHSVGLALWDTAIFFATRPHKQLCQVASELPRQFLQAKNETGVETLLLALPSGCRLVP